MVQLVLMYVMWQKKKLLRTILSGFIIREYIKFGIVLNYATKAYTLHTVDTLDIYYAYTQVLCIYFTGEIDFKTLCRLYYIGTLHGRSTDGRDGEEADTVRSVHHILNHVILLRYLLLMLKIVFFPRPELSRTVETFLWWPPHEPRHATSRLDDGIL